ncbi:GNAT family N-acetyltransferase [Rheinheimera sp. WS51]|uniref:GNAT family N-acetyltransferase n=1 Tax=Rheinheimera sp. WS51 TaxID=3425886 RepID=UPI003D8EEB7C
MSDFIADHSDSLAVLAKQKIAEFNALHWNASLRQPLGLKKLDNQGELIAALTGRTFGNWFYLESFWLAESYRGKGLGKAMLLEAEQLAKQRGCRYVLLDTLNFQAKPFYQRLGYQIIWTQADYPFDGGAKYFMQKQL